MPLRWFMIDNQCSVPVEGTSLSLYVQYHRPVPLPALTLSLNDIVIRIYWQVLYPSPQVQWLVADNESYEYCTGDLELPYYTCVFVWTWLSHFLSSDNFVLFSIISYCRQYSKLFIIMPLPTEGVGQRHYVFGCPSVRLTNCPSTVCPSVWDASLLAGYLRGVNELSPKLI